MVTKINPIFDAAQARSFLSKTISVYDIVITPDISASTGPEGAIDAVLQTVALNTTIVAHSAVTAAGVTVWVEGEFPTDTYDGTNNEAFNVYLASTLVALGTVDALDLSATTVTAQTVFKADQV
jgi:hypothetical protein